MFDINYNKTENLEASLSGDLDINTVEKFQESILTEYRKENTDVILNLEDLNYIDSTGLGAIMTIYKEITAGENTLTVTNPKKNVMKLFKITELDSILNMEE